MARLLWIQKRDFGPSPRSGHALAFDSTRSRVILFGGLAATGGNPPAVLVGDTWEWDGEDWTQVDDIGPSARRWFAMAYDRNREKLVLFGGLTANGPSAETWEWDGQDWTQVSETGPPARILHAMAFDSIKNTVTLFGGQLQQGDPAQESSYLNDTWEWNGVDWAQQEDTGPARCAHAMAYDDNRKRLVLFGGSDAQKQEFGDTWEWDGTTWTQRSDFGPPACTGASLVFTGAECLLFGGIHSNAPQKQTWTWDGTHWTARQDIGPSARSGHAAAFDSSRQSVVLFGGQDQAQTPLGDTWEQKGDGGLVTGGLTLSWFSTTQMIRRSDSNQYDGQASFQLSAPAPANGAGITLSTNPSVNVQLSPVETGVPAGQTVTSVPLLATIDPTIASFEITATLENGNSLRSVVQVIG